MDYKRETGHVVLMSLPKMLVTLMLLGAQETK